MSQDISLQEMKKIMQDALKKYAEFCKQNDLRYYLAYGTLLGAVRHKGFIPWDDDIDVIMPRADYMRFLALTKNGLGENLSVYSMQYTDRYVYPFAKIIDLRTILIETDVTAGLNQTGVYVDVFPLDGLPAAARDIQRHYKAMYYLQRIHMAAIHVSSRERCIIEKIIKRFGKKICALYGHKRIAAHMDKLARRYEFDSSDNVGVVLCGYGKQEAIGKEAFMKPVQVAFEGTNYLAPANYENYLANLYGDYMQLPPEEKRVSTHCYHVQWREDISVESSVSRG